MNNYFLFLTFFCLFINTLLQTVVCEKSEILPIGNILSGISDIVNVVTPTKTNTVELAGNNAPRINLKVVPSTKLRITKSDFTFLLSELKQEIRRQINILEDELEEKERMRQRMASLMPFNQSTAYNPKINEDKPQENDMIDEEEEEEIDNLLNSINEINVDDKTPEKKKISIDIELKDNANVEVNEMNKKGNARFKQQVLRNGPLTR
ncbi:secreted ookinete protein, putative [Hepatocystis sp. ex Piliocolobus tephrosceles]|nr:secreted ookinete protein, putative [Hepatocystis sp. ex Piliocolobus tephrosceles]